METTSGSIVALGEEALVAGFALAGAHTVAAATADDVRAAWQALPSDVALVVLTAAAGAALEDRLGRPESPLWVVMPG
jgi:vacuolar-type H+-ATPase subunit F/Vma7